MSRVLKSDKLKTKKQEAQYLRSDVGLSKNVFQKKPSLARAPKTQTHLSASISDAAAEEKERNKKKLLINSTATRTTSNNVKVRASGPPRTQLQERTSRNAQQANNLAPRKTSTNVSLRAKELSSTSKGIREASQKHPASSATSTKMDKKSVHRKQNPVLDTPQNVTVCSPPPTPRREKKVVGNDDQQNNGPKLMRKGSRVLAPEEIIVLKRESAKIRSEEKLRSASIAPIEHTGSLTFDIKEPVAFEIKFEGTDRKAKSISREKINATDGTDKNNEEFNYSDDFESYESDFETDSSTHSVSKSDSSSTKSEDVSEGVEDAEVHGEGKVSEANPDDQLTSDEDDPEVVENTMKKIKRDKERNLDSGLYEMTAYNTNGSKSSDTSMSVQFTQPKRDSSEMFSLGISEQPDSGISTCATSIPESFNRNNMEIIYGGYKDFYTRPIINQRGLELMNKVQLDILSFDLVDLKPISYDIFMQTFGKLNTNQNFTQTEGNHMDVEQQTEVVETRSIWTQHPSHFDVKIAKNLVKNRTYQYYRDCCGEVITERQSQYQTQCELEQSLEALKELNNQSSKRSYWNYQNRQRRPINYEHLNSFLLRSSLLIDQILGSSNTNTTTKKSASIQNAAPNQDQVLQQVSGASFHIEANILDTLHVLKLFANNKHNLLITVHESLPDTNVYRYDFANLLMVWCANTCDRPLRLLTTWSQVSKVEISNDSSDIIVAALRDGSIALWDLRETHSFCSKLDGHLTHFPATQSLIPSLCGEKSKAKLIADLGACLDIKSFRSQTNNLLVQKTNPRTQFVSLHDSGIVTVWTLVEASEAFLFDQPQIEKYEKLKYSPTLKHTFEYTSPWARVKLMQSNVVNLKEYFETKTLNSQSRFEKTKTFFQKNIYSDELLKELNQCASEVGQQGLRFTSLECGSTNVFICTNRNYILMCSKILKMEKLKRIMINESQFLFPTALKVLSNEDFLAIGLSNGVVMILNCQSDENTHAAHKTARKSRRPESIAPSATNEDSILDGTGITGKSCAIQNILLNVEKSYGYMDFNREYRPPTAECITLIDSKKKPFELRIIDQQVIMMGSVLRKNLIQSLEISSDGWYLFALTNGQVRIYNFYVDQEISGGECPETDTIIDIATGKCGYRENNLMILRPNSKVEVHILNK